ncbi:MAG: chemotaxis protein CheB [Alphaproteobacteria bacterium]|nr:chemotaxis protein CheB [Alphaproteobacteria bacterium]MCW5740004.1 chemotaxis protein CheB [Alphaproteobacteria bacterium]
MRHPAGIHDIAVIGGSAGSLEVLQRIVANLPEDLPAAIFVVVHTGAVSHLARILDRVSALPVMEAANGAVFEPGHIYVATPDRHLMLHDDHILLRRGPRENLSRPAIDPLFRSAAATFGSHVIGVVLSGALSDGTAGLKAIKRCGGLAVVQDPADAMVPHMPQSAMRHVEIDHVADADALGPLLARLVRQPAGPTPEIPFDIRLETAIAAQELADMKVDDMLGTPSRFTCPECHGALWEIEDNGMLRYRCHVGHAYNADTVLSSQGAEADRLLGTLLRSHQERAALARRMSAHEREQGRDGLADHLAERALDYSRDVQLIMELMRDGGGTAEMLPSAQSGGTTRDEQEA